MGNTTPSSWPIWKWIHINIVAPFKLFRIKIRSSLNNGSNNFILNPRNVVLETSITPNKSTSNLACVKLSHLNTYP